MTDKPTKPPTDEEAELALLMTYWRKLQQERFYGVVTLTLAQGEIKHVREDRTKPVPALAAALWDKLPDRIRPVLEDKYKGCPGFDVDSGTGDST